MQKELKWITEERNILKKAAAYFPKLSVYCGLIFPDSEATQQQHRQYLRQQAQLVKRLNWAEIRACTVNDEEAYQIKDAICKLQSALAYRGYAPGRSLIRQKDRGDLPAFNFILRQ
ncbi:hypothetical protein GEA64_16930 [Photorhabdus khanii]|uniref:Uncharacterized protein n=1 Tax=Photorhabdus khanii TaxID=1004150 RepID=A0A7C9GLS2_9GAMM|nr:hypothetical protein [Photorhabdus khanii]